MICPNRTMESEVLLPQESQSHYIGLAPRRQETNRLHAWMAALLVLGAAFSLDARADYLIGNPQIYLRNLNTFEAAVQGTAPWTDYNYWIDLSTDGGKACWATLLAKKGSKRTNVFITSQTANGAILIAWFG
jgi:hypothetical protein